MPALVAVMIMVSIGTFSWNSIANLRRHPPTSSIVMLTTVVVVVATHDLSLGVLAGVLLSGIFFAGKVQRMFAVDARECRPTARTPPIALSGQIFFASVDRFTRAFQAEDGAERVTHRRHRRRISGTSPASARSTRSWRGCVATVAMSR